METVLQECIEMETILIFKNICDFAMFLLLIFDLVYVLAIPHSLLITSFILISFFPNYFIYRLLISVFCFCNTVSYHFIIIIPESLQFDSSQNICDPFRSHSNVFVIRLLNNNIPTIYLGILICPLFIIMILSIT